MCGYSYAYPVNESVTAITGCLPNFVDSRLSDSPQLKPNVITVFVNGMDKRLKGGCGPVRMQVPSIVRELHSQIALPSQLAL